MGLRRSEILAVAFSGVLSCSQDFLAPCAGEQIWLGDGYGASNMSMQQFWNNSAELGWTLHLLDVIGVEVVPCSLRQFYNRK